MQATSAFAVFPYLFTRASLRIRGVELLSSGDLTALPAEAKAHLATLCGMFFAGDGAQVGEMTCGFLPLSPDATERRRQLTRLFEAHLLIAYLYSAPHPGGGLFLPYECSSLFVFHEERVPGSLVWPGLEPSHRVRRPDADATSRGDFLPGYEGRRNGVAPLWVADGSRIYPELPHVTLNLSQSLADDLGRFLDRESNWALRRLVLDDPQGDERSEIDARVFAGLEWYLRSCRGGIGEDEALVHVAIALESLLKVRAGEGLTERFKDAILTLVGPVPRLDSWLEQFYTARSKAVHEGAPHEIAFYAVDKEQAKRLKKGDDRALPHRTLVEYGRRIFRLCLANLVTADAQACSVGLQDLFIHNRERLESICKVLADGAEPAPDRLDAIGRSVYGLNEHVNHLHEAGITLDAVLGASRSLLRVFKESGATLGHEADDAVTRFLAAKAEGPRFQFESLEAVAKELQASYRAGGAGSFPVVLSFLEYATGPGFSLRCLWDERAARAEEDA